MSGVIGASVGSECHWRRQMASGIVAERRGAPSGDVKGALLVALFVAIPHRPLMRYGEHSCKKLKKLRRGNL